MSEAKYTSVVDKPKSAQEVDLLGIDRYEAGLVRFIERTQTPITIAIQGEWGSGKTSLMNKLKDDLCDKDGVQFIPIWLNTWQYSLMKEPDQALISIMRGLTDEVAEIADKEKSETGKKIKRIFGNVVRATANVALRAATGQEGGEIVDAFDGEKETTILQLRNTLNQAINDILNKEGKSGFIFFIDDLDRIDPPMAVQILELLKNVFDLERCVFVLAIDYDVVVKGLEPKFGVYNEKNEREFRSFFDKIIQLPFSMPTASYEINDFLVSSLEAIGYLSEDDVEDQDFTSDLSEITQLSIGSNPRSLKRLLNSISLIRCINTVEETKEEVHDEPVKRREMLFDFALINIQTAYPSLYSLLVRHPAFDQWDDKLAMELNLPEVDNQILEKLSSQEEFDEDWERLVFRFCQRDHFLKKKALSISRLLNKIRSYCSEDDNLEDLVSSAISLSAVTSVEAFEGPVSALNTPLFLRNLISKLVKALNERFKGEGYRVECNQKRFQANGFLDVFYEGKHRTKIRLTPAADKAGVKLAIVGERRIFPSPAKKSLQAELAQNELEKWFEDLSQRYEAVLSSNPRFNNDYPLAATSWRYKKKRILKMHSIIMLKNSDELNNPDLFNQIAEVTEETIRLVKLIIDAGDDEKMGFPSHY